MKSISFEDVVNNYETHPKFVTNLDPWTVSESLLQKFSQKYGQTRTQMTKRNLEECLSCLSEIFKELRKQTLDTFEIGFIQELERYVKAFVIEEFHFRKKLPKNQGIKKLNPLQENGFYFLDLPKHVVQEILSQASPLIAKFQNNAKKGLLKRSDLSENSGVNISGIVQILNREFRRNGTFRTVSEYVGIRYRRVSLTLELSSAGSTWWRDTLNKGESPKTMYAHLDETVFLPKAIVYLTEVGMNNGPTSCFPGKYTDLNVPCLADIIGRVVGKVGSDVNSDLNKYYDKPYHQSFGSPKFRAHFMRLPPNIRMNSHFGWDIKAGSELERTISQSEVVMLGSPGKTIVFDGSQLLHRGGLIEEGERVVLQVIFYPQIDFRTRLKEKYQNLKVR